MRVLDRVAAITMHATARWTVRYGDELRFAGADLPPPQIIRVPTRHGRIPVHRYRPHPANSCPGSYVHFHGGAWLMRYPRMDDWWCRYVAATAGVTVFNVDFRTGPYVTFPVAQHQCYDVATWIAMGGPGPAVDTDRVAVGGFSSGGGLAASVCLQARDNAQWQPALQVLGVPALDLATDPRPTTARMITADLRELVRRVYFPDPTSRTHPYASPVLAPDVSGLPPAIVLTAELDTLRTDGERYCARLRDAGVPVVHDSTPGADHYFLNHDLVRARATMRMTAAAIAHAVTGPR